MTSATVAPLILRLDQAPASKKNMNYDLILAKAFEFQRKLPADVQRVVGVADCVALVLACLASGRHFRLTPIDADGCGVEVITQPGSNRSPLQESPGQESPGQEAPRQEAPLQESPRQEATGDRFADHGLITDGFSKFWAGLFESTGTLSIATSGTSSRPTWVTHDFRSLNRSVRLGEHHGSDRWGLAFHPITFAGLQVIFQALTHRNLILPLLSDSHLTEVADTPKGAAMGSRIRAAALSHLSATPTFFRTLLSRLDSPCPAVQSITLGGEALDPHLHSRLQQAFPNARVRNIYASTELGSVLQSSGDVFTIADDQHQPIKIQDGELWVRPSDTSLNQDGLNTAGYFETGDQVEIVANQPLQFRFVGRSSTIINVGGRKVDPVLVEGHLEQMSEVESALVFGKANSVSGNLVAAEVLLNEGQALDVATIRQRLNQVLQPFQMPRLITFVAQIPRTATGKKKRRSE